ncbi:MAG: TolC family protein [Firmicutes bacterium]|nr:TolC family protein [Bacillota bacterium]
MNSHLGKTILGLCLMIAMSVGLCSAEDKPVKWVTASNKMMQEVINKRVKQFEQEAGVKPVKQIPETQVEHSKKPDVIADEVLNKKDMALPDDPIIVNAGEVSSGQSTQYEKFIPGFPLSEEKVITLDECLKFAFDHNPDILTKRAVVAQQETKLRQVLSQYDPTLSLELSQTNSMNRTTPYKPAGSTQSLFNISQTLYDWDQRRQQYVATKESLEAVTLQLNAAWIDTAFSITKAYYDLIYYQWLVAIEKDDVDKAQNNLDVSKGFYRSGAKSKIDVTQAEIELNQSQIDLENAENNYRDSVYGLAKATGMDKSMVENRVTRNLLLVNSTIPQRDDAVRIMEKTHPAVINYMAFIRSSLSFAKAYEYQRHPTLAGQAYYGLEKNTQLDMPNMPFGDTWQVNVTLSFPIFRESVVYPKADEQRAIAEQYKGQMKSTILKYLDQIDSAYTDMFFSRNRERIADREVKTALLNYKLAYKRYKMGVSTIIELNYARDYLNQARKHYLSALYSRKNAEASLFNAIGQIDPQK